MPENRRHPPQPEAATPPAAATDFSRQVHCLLGLPFDAIDLDGAIRSVRRAAARHTPCVISTPNVNFLVGCRADPDFRDSVIASDLSLADGMPVVWLARLLGIPLPERVSGAGLFAALGQKAGSRRDDPRLGVYFFGGPAGVASRACRRLNAVAGGLRCVGCDSPGFGPVEAMSGAERLERINRSHADFLVLSLGARKGQAWIARNRSRLAVPVVSHLGAVVNYVAGTVARAPAWMQRLGLEWLWRIKEEPALWRRYFGDALTLARLLFGRVLPQLWAARRHPPPAAALAAAGAETEVADGRLAIRLHGAWNAGNLQAFRLCLDAELLAGRDVDLDLQAVSHVDSAFIGLLMLLHGHQRRQGRQLRIGPLQAPVRQTFIYACAEFLLAGKPV